MEIFSVYNETTISPWLEDINLNFLGLKTIFSLLVRKILLLIPENIFNCPVMYSVYLFLLRFLLKTGNFMYGNVLSRGF